LTRPDVLTTDASVAPSAARHHLPRAEEFLYLPPWVQPYAYRIVDKLFAHRTIPCGQQPRSLPRGPELSLVADGLESDVGAFMNRNAIVGILVIHRGRVVLERYALGLQEHDRWSTMSTVKSMTAMLVGAAIHDGAIKTVDEALTRYLPESSDHRFNREIPSSPRQGADTAASEDPIVLKAGPLDAREMRSCAGQARLTKRWRHVRGTWFRSNPVPQRLTRPKSANG
jgi:CubicO group peptidase (beta-lactamase class C family)